MFKPGTLVLNTPIRIKHRTETTVGGVPSVSYADASSPVDFCNWKGKGGTEKEAFGVPSVEDTAELIMWFRPDIQKWDQVLLNDDPAQAYEVTNVENVEMRGFYAIIKVKKHNNDITGHLKYPVEVWAKSKTKNALKQTEYDYTIFKTVLAAFVSTSGSTVDGQGETEIAQSDIQLTIRTADLPTADSTMYLKISGKRYDIQHILPDIQFDACVVITARLKVM